MCVGGATVSEQSRSEADDHSRRRLVAPVIGLAPSIVASMARRVASPRLVNVGEPCYRSGARGQVSFRRDAAMSRTTRLLSLLVAFAVPLAVGCSPDASRTDGFGVDEDASADADPSGGEDADQGKEDGTSEGDGGEGPGDVTSTDSGEPTDSSGGTDGGGEPDASQGEDGSAMACDRNRDCPSDQICCPVLDGDSECRPSSDCDFREGGICEGEADCADGEVCCDVQLDDKICVEDCPGNTGSPCTTNADCGDGEFCCPPGPSNGDEPGTCESDCTGNGGLCSSGDQCASDETCCDPPIGSDQICTDPDLCP